MSKFTLSLALGLIGLVLVSLARAEDVAAPAVGNEVTLRGALQCNGQFVPNPKVEDHAWVIVPVDGSPEIADKVKKIMDEFYPDKGLNEIQILSDDGTFVIDGCPCKDLKDPSRRVFRSFWVGQ